MTTKTRRKQKQYSGFVNLVEAVAAELYTEAEWKEAIENDSPLGFEHFDMLTEVYELAFRREPEAFDSIQWINTEYGMPAWVRPGVEWEP